MSLELPYGIKRLDASSDADELFGYYLSLEEACTAVAPGLRKGGRRVGIKQPDGKIQIYWWENDNDLSDDGLVPFATGGGQGGNYFKEIIKDGDFTAEKIVGGADDGKYQFKIKGDKILKWKIGGDESEYLLDANDEWKHVADALGAGVERRIDAVSYGKDGDIHYFKGTEIGQAVYPNVPEEDILKTFITITENGILVENNDYITKQSENWVRHSVRGGTLDVNIIHINGLVRNRIADLTGTIDDVIVKGFIENHPSNNPAGQIIPCWNGMEAKIYNNTDKDLILLHNDTYVTALGKFCPFMFPDGQTFIVKPNEIITFKRRDITTSKSVYLFAYISRVPGGSSSSDDISNESNVTGATVTEALNNLEANKLNIAPNGTNNLIDVGNKINPVYLPPNSIDPQEEWHSASVAEPNSWVSITYGNGKFVAVSNNGTNRVMYSLDGITWLPASATEPSSWRSVTYGNGKFVAVSTNGTNRVMYSLDGITWLPASATEPNSWLSVTYGNGKFVAVSNNGTNRVMYSLDGITWLPASATEPSSWSSVTYGNGKFVAVAQTGTNRVMYSLDGITWLPASATELNDWLSITYGNGKFVAVSNNAINRVMYSTDGITWLPAAAAKPNDWRSVTYGGGKFVAVSINGTNRVMYSSDGITWHPASATENNNWLSVTYGGGKFVAVSNTGTNRVMYSFNELKTSELINDGDGDSPFITEAQADLKNKLDKAPDGTNNLIDVDNKLNPVYLPIIDNYSLEAKETSATWKGTKKIMKITFEGVTASDGRFDIDISSFGITEGELIQIEGVYDEFDGNRSVNCNYMRHIDFDNSISEVTQCYLDKVSKTITGSWVHISERTMTPVRFKYRVTLKYALP